MVRIHSIAELTKLVIVIIVAFRQREAKQGNCAMYTESRKKTTTKIPLFLRNCLIRFPFYEISYPEETPGFHTYRRGLYHFCVYLDDTRLSTTI